MKPTVTPLEAQLAAVPLAASSRPWPPKKLPSSVLTKKLLRGRSRRSVGLKLNSHWSHLSNVLSGKRGYSTEFLESLAKELQTPTEQVYKQLQRILQARKRELELGYWRNGERADEGGRTREVREQERQQQQQQRAQLQTQPSPVSRR